MATPKRADVVAELQALRDGIAANLATHTFLFEGKAYSSAQVLKILDVFLASARAIMQARGTLHDAIVSDEKLRATTTPSVKTIRSMVGLMYASVPSMLDQFAIAPKKVRAPLTGEERLARAAKAKATRVKRRTLGKRQRAAIKGTVTGVVITPTTNGGEEENSGN